MVIRALKLLLNPGEQLFLLLLYPFAEYLEGAKTE